MPVLRLFFVLFLFGHIAAATAQSNMQGNVQTFGDYKVPYSVFNSSFLTPEIASAYDIVRSDTLAVMNIAVRKKQADGSYKSVEADVSGNQFDLIRREPLQFQQVREQDAVYYLSTFEIQDRITIHFTVNVQVDGKPPFKVTFSKMLYHDA